MKFLDYYEQALHRGQGDVLAASIGTSLGYLSQVAHGHRLAGIRTIVAIERATGGKVTAADLRPDLFAKTAGRQRKLGRKRAA
ncbi:MAG: transcriptional regulator [Gammaproteobacteria bacterium]